MINNNKTKENKMRDSRKEQLKKHVLLPQITIYRSDFEKEKDFKYIVCNIFGSKITDDEIEIIESVTLQVDYVNDIDTY